MKDSVTMKKFLHIIIIAGLLGAASVNANEASSAVPEAVSKIDIHPSGEWKHSETWLNYYGQFVYVVEFSGAKGVGDPTRVTFFADELRRLEKVVISGDGWFYVFNRGVDGVWQRNNDVFPKSDAIRANVTEWTSFFAKAVPAPVLIQQPFIGQDGKVFVPTMRVEAVERLDSVRP